MKSNKDIDLSPMNSLDQVNEPHRNKIVNFLSKSSTFLNDVFVSLFPTNPKSIIKELLTIVEKQIIFVRE